MARIERVGTRLDSLTGGMHRDGSILGEILISSPPMSSPSCADFRVVRPGDSRGGHNLNWLEQSMEYKY